MGGQEAARWAVFFVFVSSRCGQGSGYVRQFLAAFQASGASASHAIDDGTFETRIEVETGKDHEGPLRKLSHRGRMERNNRPK
jgi:hypothetical protein